MVLIGLVRHIGHSNILRYDKRPFENIQEHDSTILNNYNSVVNTNDDFYFLGDFALCHPKHVEYIMAKMNGNKFFIKGNHDPGSTVRLYEKYGTYLGNLEEIEIEKQKIVLCHYSMRVWRGNHRGTIHLYGHSHGSLERYPNGRSMDVGVNLSNYYPINFKEVLNLNRREIIALDHHKFE